MRSFQVLLFIPLFLAATGCNNDHGDTVIVNDKRGQLVFEKA